MATTRVIKHIEAPSARVYEAIIDSEAVQQWMVPDDMTSRVHRFEPWEGGAFRISLTFDDPSSAGKTEGSTDTFEGRFVKLVPGREVVQVIEFETADPDVAGEMTVTYSLSDAPAGGTNVVSVHESLPPGVSPEANEMGWRMALDKLAALVEAWALPFRSVRVCCQGLAANPHRTGWDRLSTWPAPGPARRSTRGWGRGRSREIRRRA